MIGVKIYFISYSFILVFFNNGLLITEFYALCLSIKSDFTQIWLQGRDCCRATSLGRDRSWRPVWQTSTPACSCSTRRRDSPPPFIISHPSPDTSAQCSNIICEYQ